MNLSHAQLESQLAKKLAPVYLLSGEELLLKQDAIDLIRLAAKRAGITERIRLASEAGHDGGHLYTTLYSNSLLAEKRLIELDFRHAAPNKVVCGILQAYACQPHTDKVLLLDLNKVDAKMAKSAWYSALDKIGVSVTLWPIPREQLPQWIMQRAKKNQLTLQPDAAALLADYVEGNLIAAAQQIEKLSLLQPEKVIDKDVIASLLTDESRFSIFDFIENLIAGDQTRTLHILYHLKEEGTEPAILLWAITRELRLLVEMAQQRQQGMSFDTLFQKHRIFSGRKLAVRRFLQRVSVSACYQHLSQALEIDRLIKGAATGNIWDVLQLFCLRFNLIT